MANPTLSPTEKALAINLDESRYGTFAEIGAGQEVVRWFYQVGAAAGTIAKSISAYDMTVSDAIYGSTPRYVSRERLEAILNYEQDLVVERLGPERGDRTGFFTFANTVRARSFRGEDECHGWIGVRFQARPRGAPSQIVLHVRMLDSENRAQQEALGILGVNLLYGACFLHEDPEALIASLLDGLRTDRIEVDLIEFTGDAFDGIDNRIMSLHLVRLGLSDAAMFSSSGRVLLASEVLRKRPVLIQRGRFRPVTRINLDLIEKAETQIHATFPDDDTPRVKVMEMTLQELTGSGDVDLEDFIARSEALGPTGNVVLISDYYEYYRLAAYIRRHTHRGISIVMGVGYVRELFNERHYENLDGGILESYGRLFKSQIRVYVYPRIGPDGELQTLESVKPEGELRHLYAYLIERGLLVPIERYSQELMATNSPAVLDGIRRGDGQWESQVRDDVAALIKERRLFGYRTRTD